ADGDITFDAIDPANGWKGLYITMSADKDTVIRGGKIAHAGIIGAFATFQGKTCFASVTLTISQQSWPVIENETISDPMPALPGPDNESACIYVGSQGAEGTEPPYEKQGNTFVNCGPEDVAHSDDYTP